MLKYASLFSGIGGFELGIKRASELTGVKTECVFASEIDKFAQQTYIKNFGDDCLHGDITKIEGESVPDIDFLVGGFPCQAFSIAGKRRGFEDTRGTLFFDIARIMRAKKPKIVLLENVRGLLNHDRGNTFRTILSTLDQLGYDAEWQLLNSKEFGVPQNRERVFIIGYLRGYCRGQVFPIIREADSDKGSRVEKVGVAVHSLYPRSSKTGKGGTGQLSRYDGISYCLDTGNAQAIEIKPCLTPDRVNKRQNGRRFKEHNAPAFTLTAQDKHGVMIDGVIRKLTPIECERLQGFPDNWTNGVSDSQRYKQLGNSVTVNVIQAITEKLLSSSI